MPVSNWVGCSSWKLDTKVTCTSFTYLILIDTQLKGEIVTSCHRVEIQALPRSMCQTGPDENQVGHLISLADGTRCDILSCLDSGS